MNKSQGTNSWHVDGVARHRECSVAPVARKRHQNDTNTTRKRPMWHVNDTKTTLHGTFAALLWHSNGTDAARRSEVLRTPD